jgi:hypothetical protein
MSIDIINNEFYNAYADSFDKIPFEDILIPLFLKYLPASDGDILEIGSGAGDHQNCYSFGRRFWVKMSLPLFQVKYYSYTEIINVAYK